MRHEIQPICPSSHRCSRKQVIARPHKPGHRPYLIPRIFMLDHYTSLDPQIPGALVIMASPRRVRLSSIRTLFRSPSNAREIQILPTGYQLPAIIVWTAVSLSCTLLFTMIVVSCFLVHCSETIVVCHNIPNILVLPSIIPQV